MNVFASDIARGILGRLGLRYIGVYVANCIVAHVPSHTMRLAYYRRIMGFSVGKKSSILHGLTINRIGRVIIGHNTIVNERCRLDARGFVTIGNNVSISSEVTILTADHDGTSPEFRYRERSVVVEDYAWIGTRATVLPGVTLGRGCIVAAGALVTRDVPSLEIVAGNPARSIGRRPESALRYELDWRPRLL